MKFIYYLVFFFWYLLSLLPLRVLYFISDLLFVPLFYGLKYRRDIVHRNIAGSFPVNIRFIFPHIDYSSRYFPGS